MTRHDLYGRTFACECGKTHAIEPREVLCAPDALDRLPDVCARAARDRSAVVLMDARTREAAGAAAAVALRAAGWTVREIVVPDPVPGRSPICDDATHSSLSGETAGAGLVVSVGSGVLSDLGKWLAHDAGIPCVSFATAASMNGYASANVAPTLAGVKSLLRARPPHAVLASPEILCAAPRELTTAGLGDVLAKCTSSADWRMNHLLFGDYYCARSVGLIVEIEPLYLEHPEAVAAGDARAVGALFDALLRTGVAMTMAESSAPASGGEHLISHTLDMLAVAAGGEHDLHGRQVGVGTILMCELYRRVLAVESPKFRAPPATIDARFWGKLAGAVAPCYAEKRPRLAVAAGALAKAGAWDRLRAELAPMLRPPEQVRDCLARAGGATTASDIGCDKRALAEILRRAREVRARFTILDLADLLGILDAAAGEIVQQWG